MGKPSAPTPPDPQATAAASTSTNVGTAIANAMLNDVNQNTSTGSLRYDQTGSYNWFDPYTGNTVNIPEMTATQILSPQEQAIQAQTQGAQYNLAQTQGAQYNLAGLANQSSANLSQLLANPIDLSGAPAAGDASLISNAPKAQASIDTSGLAGASNIVSNYSDPSQFQGQADQLTQSVMQRMAPQLQQQKSQLEQQLANQGINPGSPAYTAAMQNFSNMFNNAQLGAIQTGDTEQQQLNQMAAQQAAFTNQAQSQAFNQASAQGSFANTALAQNFAQTQAGVQAQNTALQNWLSQQYAARDQPINEISALLSGSQVSNPNFVNTSQGQIPTTDVAGLINQNFQQQYQNYQQASTNYNSLMGGLFGMAGGLMKMSDVREKEDIVPMGSIWATNPSDHSNDNELPIYEYSYKRDPLRARHIGPMAQDVEKIDPKAVKTRQGRKYLDLDRMGSVLGVGHG